MSIQEIEYQSVFSFLRSLHFHFLNSWVIECVNYYKSENPDISLEVLKNEVKQQWLLVNLREIKVPSLPPNLKSKKEIILNGTYAVQVESMIDSSVSCYSQFQKFLKINTENIEATKKYEEWNVKSKRCLTFVISDGVQEIEAMEYQPIEKIRSNDPELLPGFKMIIVGPVECRKGMILLKDKNVIICGGEVDTLTVSNSLKSILMKKLDFDESDYPDHDPSNFENENKIIQSSSEKPLGNVENLKNECVESLLSQNDDVFLNIPLEPEILIQETPPKETSKTIQNSVQEDHLFNQNINYWSADELKEDTDIVNNRKHSLPLEDVQVSNHKRLSFDPDLKSIEAESSKWISLNQNELKFNDDNDIFIDDLEESQSAVNINILKTKRPVQTKLSSFFTNSDSNVNSVYKDLPDCPELIYVNNNPFVYLKHIMSFKLSQPTIFTIKGIILTLKKKITIENDNFNLKVNITDGSANLDVDICSDILEKFFDFSPCEMLIMLKAKQTNSAVSQKIKEIFSRAQEKLISINCLMKIKFFTEDKSPTMLSLEDVTPQHLKALKERCSR